MAVDGIDPWLTLPTAIVDTEDLLAVIDGAEAALLRDVRDYLADRTEEAGVLLA